MAKRNDEMTLLEKADLIRDYFLRSLFKHKCVLMNKVLMNLMVLVVLVGCTTKSDVNRDSNNPKTEIPPTEVKTVKAEIRPFEYLINTSGIVWASVEAIAQSKSAGTVIDVRVKNNTNVKAGQLLVELDHEFQQLQLEKATVNLKEKQISFEDQIMGYSQGGDSVRMQGAKDNIRISSGLAVAEIAYKEAKLEFQNTFIRAPISGIVSDLTLQPGNPVATDQVICKIHDPTRMNVECLVLEEDASKIKKGIKADVNLLAHNETTFDAVVDEINPRVDENTKQVRVKLKLNNSQGLFPGMHVQVTIKVPYKSHIIVPKEAIVVRSGKTVVFTMKGNLAKWNYVTTGNENGKEVEILEGIQEGDSVIITNNLQLAHDAPVATAFSK